MVNKKSCYKLTYRKVPSLSILRNFNDNFRQRYVNSERHLKHHPLPFEEDDLCNSDSSDCGELSVLRPSLQKRTEVGRLQTAKNNLADRQLRFSDEAVHGNERSDGYAFNNDFQLHGSLATHGCCCECVGSGTDHSGPSIALCDVGHIHGHLINDGHDRQCLCRSRTHSTPALDRLTLCQPEDCAVSSQCHDYYKDGVRARRPRADDECSPAAARHVSVDSSTRPLHVPDSETSRHLGVLKLNKKLGELDLIPANVPHPRGRDGNTRVWNGEGDRVPVEQRWRTHNIGAGDKSTEVLLRRNNICHSMPNINRLSSSSDAAKRSKSHQPQMDVTGSSVPLVARRVLFSSGLVLPSSNVVPKYRGQSHSRLF